MAGTEIIFKNHFYDYCGNYCTVNIYKSGYAGTETEVTGGEDPCIISMLGQGDDKFSHIKTTEAHLNWMASSSLQFLTLFLSTNKTYKVKIFRGSEPLWYGWVNPEFYSEQLSDPPYPVTITVTDGLSLLKNIPLPIPLETQFRYSLIYYLATCLNLIGLDNSMTIKVALNLSILPTSGATSSRVLEKMFIDWRTFRDGKPLWNCFNVIEEILKTLNARLYQYGDSWWIENIDGKHTDYDIDVYSMAGVYSSTVSSFNSVIGLTGHTGKGTDIRFINSPAMIEVQPAYRGYSISQDYGNRENILSCSNFEGLFYSEDFSSTSTPAVPRYWNILEIGTSDVSLRWIEEETALQLDHKPAPTSLDYIYSNTIDLSDFVDDISLLMEKWANGDVQLVFRYRFKQNMVGDLNLVTNYVSNTRLILNCSGNKYYTIYRNNWNNKLLTGWTTSSVDGWITANSALTGNISDWYDVNIVMPLPPSDEFGNTQTSLSIVIYFADANISSTELIGFEDGDGMMITSVQVYFEKLTEKDKNYKQTEEDYIIENSYIIDNDNLLEPEDYEFKYGTTPYPYDSDGDGLINKYVIFDSDDKPLRVFGRKVSYPSLTTDDLISQSLALAYRRPQFKINGSLLDTTYSGSNLGVRFTTILQDYDNRYYCLTGGDLSLKNCILSGEWLQMYDASGTGEFNDDFNEDFWI